MFFKRKRDALKAVYMMHSVQGFAFSLVGIFIPIYLLSLNYSVSAVIKFYIAHYCYLAGFAFFAIYVASHFGLQRTIFLRFPAVFTYLILLFLLGNYQISLYIIALFSGLESALYWIPLHILFARSADKKDIGSETGKLFALPQLASMAGPFTGGLIAAIFGFKVLLGIVFIILLLSVLPLLQPLPEKFSFTFFGRPLAIPMLAGIAQHLPGGLKGALPQKPFEFKFYKGVKLFKKYPKYFIAEVFDNMGEEVEAIIWPIFVYLSLISVESVGIVGTLLSFGSITFTLIVGKLSDKYKKQQLIKVGAILLTVMWFGRFFFNSEIAIYLLTILSGFFTVLLLVPFSSLMYSLPKKDTIDEFFVFREIPVALGRVSMLLIALIFVNNLQTIFPIAGLAYLYFLFL